MKRPVVASINGRPLWFGSGWLLSVSRFVGGGKVFAGITLIALGRPGDGIGGLTVGLWMLAACSDLRRLHDALVAVKLMADFEETS